MRLPPSSPAAPCASSSTRRRTPARLHRCKQLQSFLPRLDSVSSRPFCVGGSWQGAACLYLFSCVSSYSSHDTGFENIVRTQQRTEAAALLSLLQCPAGGQSMDPGQSHLMVPRTHSQRSPLRAPRWCLTLCSRVPTTTRSCCTFLSPSAPGANWSPPGIRS